MLPGADGSIFSPNSSDLNSSLSMDDCELFVVSVFRGVSAPLSSGRSSPALLVSLESPSSVFVDEGAAALAGESSHNEKLKFEVALDGINRSDWPTSLRNRVVKDLRSVPDEMLVYPLEHVDPTDE